jgi:hypothetical protein
MDSAKAMQERVLPRTDAFDQDNEVVARCTRAALMHSQPADAT